MTSPTLIWHVLPENPGSHLKHAELEEQVMQLLGQRLHTDPIKKKLSWQERQFVLEEHFEQGYLQK